MTKPRLTIALGAALAVAAVVAGVRHRGAAPTTLFVGDDGMWAAPPASDDLPPYTGYWTPEQYAKRPSEALPAYANQPRWYDVKPGELPALTGDATATAPLSSSGVITCECPPCPKHRRRCQETTDVINEHTREPTGLLVRVHRNGQPPPLPLNPSPYVPTMSCECPRCP
jgi:hypothetical protein